MMHTTIWKFPVNVDDTITIPVSGEVVRWLHVEAGGYDGHSRDDLVLWAEVHPDTMERTYTLHVRGTGHPMTGDEGRHIGTVLTRAFHFVWHVFEPKEDGQ